MDLSATQIFDLVIIVCAAIYIFSCKAFINRIMPLVHQAYAIPGKVDSVLRKGRLKLILTIPFAYICLGFAICRAFAFFESIGVEPWEAWFVCIMSGLMSSYILALHYFFKTIAKSVVYMKKGINGEVQ